jgi:predicted permease
VVAEVALALMLVTGAGLLLKSYSRALVSDLGFNAEGLITANYWFPSSRYPDNAARQPVFDQLMAVIESRPEVSNVAMASMVPVREFGNNYTEVSAVGGDRKASFVEIRYVTPDYFETLDIRILRGRTFTEDELRAQSGPIMINQTLARQLFGDDEDPLEWQLSINGNPQIIGVVEDVRDFGPDKTPRPTMYGPSPASNLLIRSSRPATDVAQLLRTVARQIDPGIALIRIQTMDEILDTALAGRRFQLTLIGVFAMTALVLSCVGIYGVLSYTVERQTREIGVRIALGARATNVASHVAWRGGQLAVIGIVLGIGGAVALRGVIASQLFAVESFDPVVYLGVSAIVLAVATFACLVPARRAAVIDPVRAINIE